MKNEKHSFATLTPVCDFVERYRESQVSRFHMPGHKGRYFLGCEPYDITEIAGADVLSSPEGILAESQNLASSVFQVGNTFFSAEGSSLCIKAMLCAAWQEARERGVCCERGVILAARNVHRAFVDACALLDFDVVFVEAGLSKKQLCDALDKETFFAVYITSPDYLGQMEDVECLAEVCERAGIPLLVDNAHGAYLGFLKPSRHPVHLGAALSCDSAHKTLPVLTGGAYLQVSESWSERLSPYISRAMSLFGSTSPSYLILQSLDLCNSYLEEGYGEKLMRTVKRVEQVRCYLKQCGVQCLDGEPLKIVIDAFALGSAGAAIAEELRRFQIECEYADDRYVVLMVTPENGEEDFARLERWADSCRVKKRKKYLCAEERREVAGMPERKMSIREAVFAGSEMIAVNNALGRVCASQTVSCPPAVPIVVSGEVIDEARLQLFQINGIEQVCVVKEDSI